MNERRRHARHPVLWPLRLWLGEHLALVGRVLDASVHGAGVALVSWVPVDALTVGRRYPVDLQIGARTTHCTATIRRLSRNTIGLEIHEPLPVEESQSAGCHASASD